MKPIVTAIAILCVTTAACVEPDATVEIKSPGVGESIACASLLAEDVMLSQSPYVSFDPDLAELADAWNCHLAALCMMAEEACHQEVRIVSGALVVAPKSAVGVSQ